MVYHLPKHRKTDYNTHATRTYRIYIMVVYRLQYEYTREKRLFDAYSVCMWFPLARWCYYIIVAKNALKTCFPCQRVGNAIFYKPLRVFFVFRLYAFWHSNFFVFCLCVFISFLFIPFLFFSFLCFLSCLLAYSLTYLLTH